MEFKERIGLTVGILVIVIAFFSFYPKVFDTKVFLGGDNAQYYLTAKSIAQGKGYTNLYSPGAKPAATYPPGYPMVMGIGMKIFGDNLNVAKKINGALLLLVSIGSVFLLKRLFGHLMFALVCGLIIVVHPKMLHYGIITMSEMTFCLASLGTMLACFKLEDTREKDGIWKNGWFYTFLVLLSFCLWTRTIGLSLIAGFGLYYLVRKDYRMAILTGVGSIVLYLPWVIRNRVLGIKSNYIGQLLLNNPYRPEEGSIGFLGIFKRIWINFDRYISKEIPELVLTTFQFKPKDQPGWELYLIGIVVLVLMGYGLYRIKVYRSLLLFYLLGTFGILLVWPDKWFGDRFILPTYPLILGLMSWGIISLVNEGSKRLKLPKGVYTYSPLLLLFFLVPFKGEQELLKQKVKGNYHQKYKDYFDVAQTFQTKPNAIDIIVVARKPNLFSVFSGTKATYFPRTLDFNEMNTFMVEKKVDYVVLDQLGYTGTYRYLAPFVTKNQEKFKMIKTVGPKDKPTYLLEFKPELGFQGKWLDGKKDSIGRMVYPDGRYYEGPWVADKKEGIGEYGWPQGQKFMGNFKNDVREGKGKMIYRDGSYMEGTWVNDRMEGVFVQYDSQGNKVKEMVMENNVQKK